MEPGSEYSKATFAAGCFWDVEAAFRGVEGVLETIAGYTGGSHTEPTYDQVGTGTTGHVEAVGLVFDPAVVSFEKLLEIFWEMHDPTRSGGQGDYTGSQYRSVIFWHTDEQRKAALASRDHLAASGRYGNRPVLTEIVQASEFWPAEDHHQRFYEKCGQGYCMSRQVDE